MTLTQNQLNILKVYDCATLCDFLFVFPQRYEIFELSDESALKDGQSIILEGLITSSLKSSFYASNKSVTHFTFVSDLTYRVSIFNRHYLKAPQDPLRKIVVVGKYKHPSQIIASTIYYQSLEQLGQIQPIYSIKNKVAMRSIKSLIHKALSLCHNYTRETLPLSVINAYQLISHDVAMREIHQPSSLKQLKHSIHRFKVAELLEYHIQVQNNRLNLIHSKVSRHLSSIDYSSRIQTLPYVLTQDQVNALKTMIQLCDQNVTATMLLQGDVGSGKTIVALLLASLYVQQGYTVAFMVPTEVLAQQHEMSAKHLFKDLNDVIYCITSSTKPSQRQHMLATNSKQPCLFIGTHALFSDDVMFQNLGLVIIDEQHRFGVAQRMKLIKKGQDVDVLSMSATPIPRTLAAVLFADMHVLAINQKPQHRGQVSTKVISGNSFISVLDDILDTIGRGEQVYVITAVIDDEGETRSAISVYRNLKKTFEHEFKIGLLHGKMKQDEKTNVLDAFRKKQISMLVSTSVIEVGVDVANATRMIIYDAHRFGLSSLHQLRGRIGRSHKDSVCYLINPSQDSVATQRLSVLEHSHDGFFIAKQDLLMRGPGDLIGLKQSGLPSFQFANIISDEELLQQTKSTALALLQSSNPHEQDYVKHVIEASMKGLD